MSDQQTHIVSLTPTAGGYSVDPETRHYEAVVFGIVAEAPRPNWPETASGTITGRLKARRMTDRVPFTVTSRNNLPGVVGLARLSDPTLADRIDGVAALGLVHRTAPAAGLRELAMVGIPPLRHGASEDNYLPGALPWTRSHANCPQPYSGEP